MGIGRALPVLLLLVGCHENYALPSLPIDNVVSGLVLVAEETKARVYAFETSQGRPSIALGASADLHFVPYGCPLERLTLKPGVVPINPKLTGSGKIPTPQRHYRTTMRDGEAAPWEEVTGPLPEVLMQLELSASALCLAGAPEYTEVALGIPTGGAWPTLAIPLPDGEALIGLGNGDFFRMAANAQVQQQANFENLPAAAGFKERDGTIWLVGSSGVVVRGTMEGGFERVGVIPGFYTSNVAIDGAPTAPRELFVASSTGSVFRFDGSSWRQIIEYPVQTDYVPPSVEWIGPGEALIDIVDQLGVITRYKDEQVTKERLSTIAPDYAVSILHGEAFGSVLGTREGKLLRRNSEQWEVLRATELNAYSRAVGSAGDGFVFGGYILKPPFNLGNFKYAHYLPGVGACDLIDTEMGFVTSAVSLSDSSFLLLGLSGYGGWAMVTLLRASRHARDCSLP